VLEPESHSRRRGAERARGELAGSAACFPR
jgi:hypothetical protein